MQHKFNVTEAALAQIKNALVKRKTPNASLRLGLKGGGCSGFSYVIEFCDNKPRSRDIIFDFDGVAVLIDKKSMLYLNGCALDWETNMVWSGFKFINPNEKTGCGCGQSFSI